MSRFEKKKYNFQNCFEILIEKFGFVRVFDNISQFLRRVLRKN